MISWLKYVAARANIKTLQRDQPSLALTVKVYRAAQS
jgi:hypothetical protein